MDEKKISIRPLLHLKSVITNEDFQNKTLRPILKLQHDLILMIFASFCKRQKVVISDFNKGELFKNIETIIKKNTVLRNQYIGLIIGQFTIEEYKMYLKKDSEFNKRILNMIVQRILDSL